MQEKVTLLGSTGSIGTQSLDVIRAQGYEVTGLAAFQNVSALERQIAEFHPAAVAVVEEAAADALAARLSGRKDAPVLLRGPQGLAELAARDALELFVDDAEQALQGLRVARARRFHQTGDVFAHALRSPGAKRSASTDVLFDRHFAYVHP